VGGIVLLTLLGSCAAGYLIVTSGGGAVVQDLRDVSVWILAFFYMLVVLFLGAIYFVLAWLVGFYGPRLPAALRWTGARVTAVEGVTERVAEHYVIRPLARTAALASEGRAFVHALTEGASAATAPVRHRLRGGGSPIALPSPQQAGRPAAQTGAPEQAGERDRADRPDEAG
jgi:hypothetical protein